MTADDSPVTIDAATTLVRAPGVHSVVVDGEAVLLDVGSFDGGSRHVLSLNPTASIIWSLLDGASNLLEIAEDLADAFEQGIDDVTPLLVDLARDLVDRNLAVPTGRRSPAAQPGP